MQQSPPVLRIALLDDHPVVLAGIATVLGASGTSFDIRQATTSLTDLEHDLDVVVLDSFAAAGVAARVAGVLRRTSAVVLFFSGTAPPPGLVGARVRHLDKGASGPELVAAVLAAADGRDPAVVPDSSSTPGSWPGQVHGLTLRESEVMALISSGLSNADVASTLFLGVNTVKTYIRTAYRKVGVTSRSTAILWALSHGFDSRV